MTIKLHWIIIFWECQNWKLISNSKMNYRFKFKCYFICVVFRPLCILFDSFAFCIYLYIPLKTRDKDICGISWWLGPHNMRAREREKWDPSGPSVFRVSMGIVGPVRLFFRNSSRFISLWWMGHKTVFGEPSKREMAASMILSLFLWTLCLS